MFALKQTSLGDIKISCNPKEPWIYHLHKNNKQLMLINFRTNREIKELYSSYDLAYGDVLLSGLGFGILTLWIAYKPGIKSVTVVEYSQDIIDIFLQSNTLPNNVTIICDDIKNYKTKEKYDCIFLDHYPDLTPDSMLDTLIEETKQIVSNVPNHTLMWIYPIEYIYINKYFGIVWDNLIQGNFILENISSQWEKFIISLDISTFPNISKEKVEEYILTFCCVV